MKILCVFGRYNYGDISRGESPEYSSFIPALKSLGHEVDFFDSWSRKNYCDLASLNIDLLKKIEIFRPDVLFTVHINYEIWLETICLIRARYGVTALTWATDDSWKYREMSRLIADSYDKVITTYPYVLKWYNADGIYNVHVSQWAAISGNLRAPRHSESCKYDVTFIGTSHGSRRKMIEALRNQGVNVVCFGHGWSNGSVDSCEIPKIINQSRICLNFANSIGPNQIKARVFEVPGAGGFLLTEVARDLEKYYRSGKEVEVFFDFDDLVMKIRYYLSNPKERNRIAEAGFQRTINEHTYEKRFEELLESELKISKIESKDLLVMDFDEVVERHRIGFFMKMLRISLIFITSIIFGKKKASRAGRRIVYEISWRLVGRKTFTSSGWPGRLFPHD